MPATLTSVDDETDILELSCGFTYDPYVPVKRINVTQTAKASFTEIEEPIFNTGQEFIDFKFDLLEGPEVKELQERYNQNGYFTLTGCYGDEYLVEFSEFIPKAQPRQLFKVTGKFRVLCVKSQFDPCFGCE